jgi:hypothetical protein
VLSSGGKLLADRFVKWLADGGIAGEVGVPHERFERVVNTADVTILIDASASNWRHKAGLERFIADTYDWEGDAERVFLIPRRARVSVPFLALAAEHEVQVFGVSADGIELHELASQR